jgi:NTE family protein
VQINPLVRHTIPTSANEIMGRINEITFNSSLLNEFRAIAFVSRLIEKRLLPRGKARGQYRHINLHRIVLDSEGKAFAPSSKLSNDYEFFEMLRDHGRRAARRFLDEHFEDIGRRSTIDLGSELLVQE